MLGAGNFLKSQKTISFNKNQSVLIAKSSSAKKKKNRQSAKISCHTVYNITSEIKEM